MDVSVTIANWNGAAMLDRCLRSVYATPRTSVDYEVIVVDNASDDDSVRLVRDAFPEARLVVNAKNVGFGSAQNQATALARGRYVLMLNNDATVEPDTIPILVRLMDEHPRLGACGCRERDQDALGTATSGAFRQFPSLRRTFMENLWALVHPPRHWDIRWLARPVHRLMGEELREVGVMEVAWIVGALLIVPRDVLVQVGGFDERFFLFDEDADLCRRIRSAGRVVAFTTRTSFSHHGGGSSALRRDIEKIRGESRALYFRKHEGRVVAALFRVQHFLLRSCLLSLRHGTHPGARRATTAPLLTREEAPAAGAPRRVS